MKKLTFLFLMCLASMGAMAKSVVFTLADGTKVYYLLGGDTNPVLRFVDGKVTVDADEYTISDIKNFYVSNEDDPNGIEDVLANQQVRYSANTLVMNAGSAKAVKVYTVGGVEVKAEVQKSDDVITVDLNGLAKGAYVVRAGNSSMKVLKK
ncbi:MAG: hypothetical protein IJ635_11250 [Bacteroidaceae bacterium]|nr:hypothetical protein [Bacteroidaceae bacterium]MBR1521797.1 hypothetical protein [Bacteroidaceae bacterium]